MITPDILEVTLRDGSYLIDFQFTAEDTATIAAALEAVGFRWIEVGHGLGLNASACGKGVAAATDEEYLEAAAQACKEARWGMFFIPGIGRAEDLRLAARYGMSFVRIGTNINEVDQARPFVELAKELGFVVCYNAMKSYAVSAAEFGRRTAQTRAWGADFVYLVDSAGGMYPDDVAAYLGAVRDHTDVGLGFHGHDNLSLAMANTLRALDSGAVLLDTSLQGMGRSSGNAITEVLVAILKQRGLAPEIDLKGAMDIGQALIRPMLRGRGADPLGLTAGFARFHSSFEPKVQQYAQKYGLDVRDLIVRLCQEDQIGAPDELLDRLGQELAAEASPRVITLPAFGAGRPRPSAWPEALRMLLKTIRAHCRKAGKSGTLNVVIAERPMEGVAISGNVQSTPTHVVGSVALTSEADLAAVLDLADGVADVVLLDVESKPFGPRSPASVAKPRLKKSLLLTYLDGLVWVGAVEDQVVRLLGEDLDGVPVVVAGDHPKSRLLAHRLARRRARVTLLSMPGGREAEAGTDGHGRPEGPVAAPAPASGLDPVTLAPGAPGLAGRVAAARLLVEWPGGGPGLGVELAAHLGQGVFVIDAEIGAIAPEAQDEARRRGALLIRVNMWPALSGALSAAHESARACRDALGWGSLDGIPIVAGGAMGRRGDVIIDNVRTPTRVLGVADGRGGVLFDYGSGEADRVRRVAEAINRRLVAPRLGGDG